MGFVLGHLLAPTSVHAYGIFQVLEHAETGFDALDSPQEAAVSPDGRHIYVVGLQSLVVAERSASTGELMSTQTFKEDALGGFRLQHVTLSPDGLNLYAAGSFLEGALLVFSRDPESGLLTPLQTLRSGEASDLLGLVRVGDLTVSIDGRFLYTVAPDRPAISQFRRHLGDGTLEFMDEVTGGNHLPELQRPQALELDAATATLYVADSESGLLTFRRNPDDGSLTFQGALGLDALAPMVPFDIEVDPAGPFLYLGGSEPNPDGDGFIQSLLCVLRKEPEGGLARIATLEDLESRSGLHMDASGSHLYVTESDTVTVFARLEEGQLQEIQQLQRFGGGSSKGTFDSEDRFLYLPDRFDHQLTVLERNPATGELTPVSTYQDGQGGTVDGLLDIEAIHATQDGADLYTLAQENQAIAQFRRGADGTLQPGQVLSLRELGIEPRQTLQGWLATQDDRFLFAVAGFHSNEFWTFRRDVQTGQLEFLEPQTVESFFPTDRTFSPDGETLLIASDADTSDLRILDFDPATGRLNERARLERPGQEFHAIAVDPSGRYIYAGGDLPGTSGFAQIRAFLWEREPDRFTDVGTFQSPVLGDEINRLEITPDGRHLVAVGGGEGAGLLVFERNLDTGQLTEIQSLVEGQDGLSGFVNPVFGAMDPSGTRLAVTSEVFPITTATLLARDPTTGHLEILEQRTTDAFNPTSGVNRYDALAWGPDGRQFYAASTLSDSLFAFDETALGSCFPGPQVLCLGAGGRFRVEVEWTDFTGQQGVGTKVTESGDSGLFWFFDPANWEMLVKVVDGCGFNGHHWVFAAATTNVAYTLTVTDTSTGVEAIYQNPLGVSSAAITDTGALNSCP